MAEQEKSKETIMADGRKDVLEVVIRNATTVIWQGAAKSVSSNNSTGPFDILPKHANFITLIEGAPVRVVSPDGVHQAYTFTQAVIYVHDNVVNIYADFN